jgi:hypothetical protein
MSVPRHFQMGVIPMENWILVNFLYRFNMLLTEAKRGVFIQIKQCLSMKKKLQKYLCPVAFCTGPLEAKFCFRYMSYEEY